MAVQPPTLLRNDVTARTFVSTRDYLNPQLAKVVKTLGFDRFYERGEGCYLYDDDGTTLPRHVERLRGLRAGPFPPGRQGRPAPGPRRRPAEHGADGLRAAAGTARRAVGDAQPRADRASRLRQLRRRGGGGGDQVRAGEHPARRICTTPTPTTVSRWAPWRSTVHRTSARVSGRCSPARRRFPSVTSTP